MAYQCADRCKEFDGVVTSVRKSDISKTVVINLGHGDLYEGFPRVTAQLWAAGHPLPEQFIGSLPPAPNIVELYRNWQSIYQALCSRRQLRSTSALEEDDELEIDSGGITNVCDVGFDELGQKLQESLNIWLKSSGFINIDQQLRTQLDPAEEIRVTFETNDVWLRRLPWHRWDFFKDYPLSEMALCRPEYKRRKREQPTVPRKKVRILAILGNSQGIDLETETQFLNSLPDAEVVFLVNPTRQEFNTQLWNSDGWDILFFAGHSQTEGETGRIYINENKTNNSLTIEQLEEALKAAINKGLRLAIFNSCDGLGLANALEKLHIPTVIVMREPVPNRVAQDFFKYFLLAFAQQRLPLYLAVQQARRKLQGVEDEFPGASWLPVVCLNPAVEPPTWLTLGGIPPCPYRGLFAFKEQDAHLFFGREQFTSDLVAAVKTKPLVAVVGPSGSGKSSVVFAGLIPRLRQDTHVQCQIVSFRPGNNPIEALAAAIAPLCQHLQQEDENAPRLVELELETELRHNNRALSQLIEKIVTPVSLLPLISRGELLASHLFIPPFPPHRLVLIVDQFEELYTQTPESERQLFLDALMMACSCAPAFTLVLTLRADFYGHALSYRPFSDALQGAIQNLGPMCGEELQSAIEQPAALMQVRLEEGLTDKLIKAAWGEPGRLPLLEFALTTLWSKHQSGWLTNQAYNEIGGVEEALANHAEAVYAQLCEADRQRAQRVFIQLVQPGVGTDANRRLATRDEVKPENWDLVTQLASARLVVTNCNPSTEEETVEIVHEALIRSWGRLEHWMCVDGAFRCWQEQLRATMRQWESSGFDEGALLRGKPLCDAQYWHQKRLIELSSGERSFIELSLALRDSEINKQKCRRQLTIWGLTGGLVGALMLTGVAWWQWQNSARSEVKAISESSATLFASNQKLDALIEAIKAQRKLQKLGWVDAATQTQVESVLRQAVYGAVEYNRLSGCSDWVWSVAFSSDGDMIASASSDKTVKLWKKDGTELATLRGHSAEVYGVAFSPDGQIIASASRDKTVKLWTKDGNLLRTLGGHSGDVFGVAFSPDGKLIASASRDRTVKLWDKDGTLLTTLTGHGAVVRGVAFSPDGQMIASASEDNTVKLWNRDGKELKTLKGHSDSVFTVAFSPDGQSLASASRDKTIRLWNRDGKELKVLDGHGDEVYGVAFSPDGQTIASTSRDKTVKLWKPDGTLLTTLAGHGDEVWGVAFSPQGNLIASASGDKTIKLWNRNNALLTTLDGHSNEVWGVAYSSRTPAANSPQENLIATTSRDRTVKLWKQDGTLLTTLNGHQAEVNAVAFSPDGQTIASGSWDKTVKLWQKNGTLLTTLNGHSDLVYGVAFSPDGQSIASVSSDKTVKLWKKEGTELATLNNHNAEVWSVAFSSDGQTIASGSRDKTIKLWNRDGKELKTLNGHRDAVSAVAFSPDGQLIASGSWDKTVKLWKRDGTLLTTLKSHEAEVYGVAFSPDGQMIASASRDKTVKLWRQDGTLLATLNGHSGAVKAVAFNPDGKTLASASSDKTVIVWKLERVLDLDQLMVYGCDWVRDYLRTNAQVNESASQRNSYATPHLCDRVLGKDTSGT